VTEEIHTLVARQLKRIDQRYTSGRREVIEVLVAADRPLTIPEIVTDRPSLATSSVYRHLAVLERAGVAARIVTTHEHARYELAEGLTAHHHHHLVCQSCGSVADFTLPAKAEEQLDKALRSISRRAKFTSTDHRLDLVGVCPNCR